MIPLCLSGTLMSLLDEDPTHPAEWVRDEFAMARAAFLAETTVTRRGRGSWTVGSVTPEQASAILSGLLWQADRLRISRDATSRVRSRTAQEAVMTSIRNFCRSGGRLAESIDYTNCIVRLGAEDS